jgi:hypothetical protein
MRSAYRLSLSMAIRLLLRKAKSKLSKRLDFDLFTLPGTGVGKPYSDFLHKPCLIVFKRKYKLA